MNVDIRSRRCICVKVDVDIFDVRTCDSRLWSLSVVAMSGPVPPGLLPEGDTPVRTYMHMYIYVWVRMYIFRSM